MADAVPGGTEAIGGGDTEAREIVLLQEVLDSGCLAHHADLIDAVRRRIDALLQLQSGAVEAIEHSARHGDRLAQAVVRCDILMTQHPMPDITIITVDGDEGRTSYSVNDLSRLLMLGPDFALRELVIDWILFQRDMEAYFSHGMPENEERSPVKPRWRKSHEMPTEQLRAPGHGVEIIKVFSNNSYGVETRKDVIIQTSINGVDGDTDEPVIRASIRGFEEVLGASDTDTCTAVRKLLGIMQERYALIENGKLSDEEEEYLIDVFGVV